MHRLRVTDIAAEVRLGPRELHHLRVLRLRVGTLVRVFDGRGAEAEAIIETLDEGGALLRVTGEAHAAPEMPSPVVLAVALLKGDKLADVIRAATELGVTRVQLLRTQHADVPDIGTAKLERLRRVASEAARQSRRAVVPDVSAPMNLRDLPATTQGFVAHPGSDGRLTQLVDWSAEVTLVSGPEGGLSDQEVELLAQRGYRTITLGGRILRAETAPIAMLGALAATGV